MDDLLYNQLVTLCEGKGKASCFNFEGGDSSITDIAWTYTDPTLTLREIKNYLSFYASKVDACYV